MERLSRSLLYEMIRYTPDLMFMLLSLCKKLKKRVSGDLSYLHYLLEQCFLQDNVRNLDWEKSLDRLYEILARRFTVAFWANSSNFIEVYDPFDEYRKGLEMNDNLSGVPMVRISSNKLFYCGGCSQFGQRRNDAYIYDFQINWYEAVKSMTTARMRHAMVHVEGKVYVFGGTSARGALIHCEVYTMKDDDWKSIASLPSATEWATATVYLNEIWIAGEWNKILAYDYSANKYRETWLLSGSYAVMIRHRTSLYIITSGSKTIQVTTGYQTKDEILNEDAPEFRWICSTTAYLRGKYYIVDNIKDLLVFDVENQTLTKGGWLNEKDLVPREVDQS